MASLIFYIFSFLLIIAALRLITSSNSVYSVLYLIWAFLNSAVLLLLIGAEYIAMTLVIVYVGAIAVLFLFVVMMLDIKVTDTVKPTFKRFAWIVLLLTISFSFLYSKISYQDLNNTLNYSKSQISAKQKVEASELTNTEAIGHELFTNYILQLQVAGIVLLVAMIGAIVLSISGRKKVVKRQDVKAQLSRDPKQALSIVDVKSKAGVKLP